MVIRKYINGIVLSIMLFLTMNINVRGQYITNVVSNGSWKEVDTLFSALDNAFSPGVSIGIVWNHQPVYIKSYGMSDIENKVKVNEETSFNLASLTKQFTAYAVLLLAEEGKLSMEDPITKYLPELKLNKVTVRQLMNQTSGIPSEKIASYGSFPSGGVNELLRLYEVQTLVTEPGTQWVYNNNNYNLLSIIIERVSGKKLEEFLAEKVFKPLKMSHSYFPFGPGSTKENRAYGYVKQNNQFVNVDKNDVFIRLKGAGGMYSSVSDLMRWNNAFYSSNYAAKQRSVDGKYVSGEPVSYGAGVNVSHQDGILSIEHGGTSGATSTYMAIYPEYGASIIVLVASNYFHANQGAQKLTQQIKQELFKRYLRQTKHKINDQNWSTWSIKKLQAVVGNWFGEINGTLQKVQVEVTETGAFKLLFFDKTSIELKQVDKDSFKTNDYSNILVRISESEISIMDENKRLGWLKRISSSKPLQLPENVTGNYTADALNNSVWSFSIEGNVLNVINPMGRKMALEPIFENIVGNPQSNIYFEQIILPSGKKTWSLLAGQIPKIQLRETEIKQALPLIVHALESGGIETAWKQFHSMRKQEKRFDFSEPGLNNLGYSLLSSKRPVEALAVFQMMVELFPKSVNALDSMADGLLANNKKVEARKTYQAILAIDPYHVNARAMLSQLQ